MGGREHSRQKEWLARRPKAEVVLANWGSSKEASVAGVEGVRGRVVVRESMREAMPTWITRVFSLSEMGSCC